MCLPWFGLGHSAASAALEPAVGTGSGWQRIYVDPPGCGESRAGREHSDAVVDAMAEFITRQLGSRRILLAGCSYGGYIAAALARRLPQRIAGLLLICYGPKIRPEDRDLPETPSTPAPEGWLVDVPADLREHLSVAIGNRTREVATRVGAIVSSANSGDDVYLRRLQATGYQLSDEDSPVVFEGPTCIVAGRHDRIVGYADQFRSLAAYPNGSFHALDGAGHYLPFERPDEFAGLMRSWLSRCASQLTGLTP